MPDAQAESADGPLVDVLGISRTYGPVEALRAVDLRLERGTVGLVGNNGAGKSTLLKILLGLLEPNHGSGTVLGVPLDRAGRELRGRVGYMAEAAAVVPGLKGVEFVTLSGDLYGMPHRQAQRRAHEVLYYVGLGELRYRRLEEYSTGNQQRLKLAAALVHDPELLLLDEPTSGLDPPGRRAFLSLLKDLVAESGKSLMLCTHLLGDIEQLCSQVVMLHQGTVLYCGSRSGLNRQSQRRYELSWQGKGEFLAQRLYGEGIGLERSSTEGRGHCTLPEGMSTQCLFRCARDAGAVLTQLREQEDNLDGVFQRLTEDADNGGSP